MAIDKKAPRTEPTQARSKETVRALLEAARTCIARKGIEQVTVAEIASVAGVGIASLYQYFGTKEAIVAACAEADAAAMLEKFSMRAMEVHQTRAPLDECVPELVCLALSLFREHARIFSAIVGLEYAHRTAERWEMIRRATAAIEGLLRERAEDDARLRNKNLRTLSRVSFQAVSALGSIAWTNYGEGTDVLEYEREVGRMVARYLLGSESSTG
jgi:AcrR family transcriptional regulator